MAKDKNKAPQSELPAENDGAPENVDTAPVDVIAAEPETPSLEDELRAERDRSLRLAAEYDNYRKRSQKEREAMFGMIRADTVEKFLPVYDNIARALAQHTEDAAYYKGVEMIFTQLREIFDGLGVSEIPAVGESFDPALHEAVMHVEDESRENGEIIEEFEKGFKLGDKVIRFSKVKTAN